ncbi:hypothetical protein VNO78_28864 [Psophocarpus tetragonolobus]|uniref:Uncharacterized protein n=1 Tax=Psophocarpus tetragonolobus TaxID=3891 RepID=A0AAN9X1N1_PSOTE
MEMKKKSFWIVMIITVLTVSSQFCFVHGRVLRPQTLKTPVGDGCENFKAEDSSLGMVTFAVSSNNSSTRQFVRSLAYRLASGPSKKGPGGIKVKDKITKPGIVDDIPLWPYSKMLTPRNRFLTTP